MSVEFAPFLRVSILSEALIPAQENLHVRLNAGGVIPSPIDIRFPEFSDLRQFSEFQGHLQDRLTVFTPDSPLQG
jgi:hypothetical protein